MKNNYVRVLDELRDRPEFVDYRIDWLYTPMICVKIYFRHSQPDYTVHMTLKPDDVTIENVVRMFNEIVERPSDES